MHMRNRQPEKYVMPVLIEPDEDAFVASCPVLQGCDTWGFSYDDVLDSIRDAIEVHLEFRTDHGFPIPEEYGIGYNEPRPDTEQVFKILEQSKPLSTDSSAIREVVDVPAVAYA